jgi:Protein of unknown function (DUF3684)
VDRLQLQLVFARMLGAGTWSHVDLARYLVSVKDMLTEVELDRLKETRWLPREREDPVKLASGKMRVVRYVLGLSLPNMLVESVSMNLPAPQVSCRGPLRAHSYLARTRFAAT